jgi:hypothetical protein
MTLSSRAEYHEESLSSSVEEKGKIMRHRRTELRKMHRLSGLDFFRLL